MPSFEYDLRFLQAGLDQIESFLLSDDIYRPVGAVAPHGEAPIPQFTLGAALLALRRARVTAVSSAQQGEITRVENEYETWRAKWRSAWGRKAQSEFRSRLNLWRDFIEDYRHHPDSNYDRFAYETTRRAMLELLGPEAADLPLADSQMLAGLDSILKALLLDGDFVWEDALKPAFPPQTFWYLYGVLPKTLGQDF